MDRIILGKQCSTLPACINREERNEPNGLWEVVFENLFYLLKQLFYDHPRDSARPWLTLSLSKNVRASSMFEGDVSQLRITWTMGEQVRERMRTKHLIRSQICIVFAACEAFQMSAYAAKLLVKPISGREERQVRILHTQSENKKTQSLTLRRSKATHH